MSEPMAVKRVEDETGSHIEPPLDELWSNHDKLRWHLAVTLGDLGLPADAVTIEPGNLTVGSVPQESYVLVMPGRFITTGGYYDAWRLINGMEIGAWVVRKIEAPRLEASGGGQAERADTFGDPDTIVSFGFGGKA